VGRYFDISDEDIVAAICSHVPSDRRSQIVEKSHGVKIIVDAYNANPDSMAAAIETLSAVEGPKAAVLGDMLELENAEQAHRAIGTQLQDAGVDRVLLVGEWMAKAAEMLDGAMHFESSEEVKKYVSKINFEGYSVLLKGSRKMSLEQLVPEIN